jgi:hypothetical protein
MSDNPIKVLLNAGAGSILNVAEFANLIVHGQAHLWDKLDAIHQTLKTAEDMAAEEGEE